MDAVSSTRTRLRLEHPALDFWVDVVLMRENGRWLAVADLAGTPEPAAADRADLALLLALWPLGPAIAQRLVRRTRLPGSEE